MIPATKVILQKILTSSSLPLVQNLVANLLYSEIPLSLSDIDDLFSQKSVERKMEDKTDSEEVKDYRIKSIAFSNFRSIPADSDYPYGVSFTRPDGKPLSLFIVGKNSTNKTTLYSALEHHYVSENSMSREMNLDRQSYLTFGFNRIKSNDQIKVSTNVRMVCLQEEECSLENHQPHCSPAPFCSEYDLYRLGQQGERLYDYLLEQLGYSELSMLKQKLNELKKDIDRQLEQEARPSDAEPNSEDINEVIKNFTDHYRTIKETYNNLEDGKTLFDIDKEHQNVEEKVFFKSYWQNLYNLTQDAAVQSPIQQLTPNDKDNTESFRRKKLENLYERLDNMFRQFIITPTTDNYLKIIELVFNEKNNLMKNEVRDILPPDIRKQRESQRQAIDQLVIEIEAEQFEIIKLFRDQHFKMIDEIMEQFSYNDGHLFVKEMERNKLVIMVKDPLGTKDFFEATPQEYYNSFRFKLYAVSFKVALSLMEMQLKHIRIPIVIDDVFNASDFENNICLESFVYSIFKAYNGLGFEEPLQLILLTHDEMIQTAFRKGAQMAGSDYICGRMFPYKIAKRMHNDVNEKGKPDFFYNLYMPN